MPPDWPKLELETDVSPKIGQDPPADAIDIGEDRAQLRLAEAGLIDLRREPLLLRLETTTALSPDAILHPFLGLPAAIANAWLGRASLHGGAFVRSGRAWGLLGIREAGKSATLGQLLRTGHQVISDDILVIDGLTLFAGPRSVDLREEAAAIVGGEPLGRVGNRFRWRLRPPDGPAAMPLGGFVSLEWGEALRIEPLHAEQRLRELIAACVLRPDATSGTQLLELASLPAWRFVRPRDLTRLSSATARLLEILPV